MTAAPPPRPERARRTVAEGRDDPFASPADTDGALDWDKALRLAWRPAWSIRSRRGSVAPFLDMVRGWRDALRRR